MFPDSKISDSPLPEGTAPEEERHQRKCSVCHHPDREEIEEEFVHWTDVWSLAKQYDIADYRSIYRHARAFGLLERRRQNCRAALDRIIEAGPGKMGVNGIIDAIRGYACLTDDNRWVEIPTRVEYLISRGADQLKSAKPLSTEGTVAPDEENVLDVAPASEPEPDSMIPEPEVIHHAGTPPGPLPAWDGRFISTWGDPPR